MPTPFPSRQKAAPVAGEGLFFSCACVNKKPQNRNPLENKGKRAKTNRNQSAISRYEKGNPR